MKTVAFFNNIHSSSIWHRLAAPLREEGVRLLPFGFGEHDAFVERIASGEIDILITSVSGEMPGFRELYETMLRVPVRVGLDAGLPEQFSTCSAAELERLRGYFSVLSKENFHNGLRRLAGLEHLPCKEVRTSGIFHPDAGRMFGSVQEYLAWLEDEGRFSPAAPVAGVIMHYNQLAEDNHADIDALLAALEAAGLVPYCVFCNTAEELPGGEPEERYAWFRYFRRGGLRPDIVLNCLAGRLILSPEDRTVLQELDVPFMQLVRNFNFSPEEWLKDPVGISSMSLTHSLVQPEMFGAVDPVMYSASVRDPGDPPSIFTAVPIPERVAMAARRAKRWAALRRMENADKRVAVILHNNPCKGFESTVGMAVGLDTFESLLLLLRRMRDEGYRVGELPETGRELLDTILERKALLEFRWTTVDEIVRKGGMLHAVSHEEYMMDFGRLDPSVQEKVAADWGAFPGEGMVFRQDDRDVLVVTGLRFGNVLVMAQPKRGCYGARCDGEVCRILHDPDISPPHHWLATYFWLQREVDVVVHFGTSGSLEYLPGKRAVLSGNCFSDISLGDLPNVYPYVMDVPGEGMTAKRRGRAVIIDHLTPVYRPAVFSGDLERFEKQLQEYRRAADGDESLRMDALLESMLPGAVKLKFLAEGATTDDLRADVETLARKIALLRRSMVPDGLHVFGRPPGTGGVAAMLVCALPRLAGDLPSVEEIADSHPDHNKEVFTRATEMFSAVLDGNGSDDELKRRAGELPPELKRWCLETAEKLCRAGEERENVILALRGAYIDAALAASPSSGKADVLPSGRNFYAADIMSMPSEAAWSVGRELGDLLLAKFYREEGRFPESIGVSLWSSDAFKSDGELLSQIFHLMGVHPVRQPNGRVTGVGVTPAESLVVLVDGNPLARPRVDVTIETSSIVRDMVPHFLVLVDKAVAAVSALDEPDGVNYVRKHTLEQLSALQESLAGEMSESEMQRLSLFRVFSSAPGTYASGVSLMLDASAWKDERDLAEAYVGQSGYAYSGASLDAGLKAHELFARQLARVEVSYIKQSSAEYDALDCSSYASSAGGMAAASRVLSGRKTRTWWADTSTPGVSDIRNFGDEIERAVRTKLCNESWIETMKQHGFQGAQAFASRISNLFKCSATTGEVDSRLFDEVVETFVVDERNREWLSRNNPYAFEEITRRLLEAEARKLWDAPEALLDAVRNAALALEGDLEESIGDVDESFQGGRIDVFTRQDVERWKSDWTLPE